MITSKPALLICFLSIIFIFSTCTTDSSITGNTGQALAKPVGIFETNSLQSDGDDECITTNIGDYILWIYNRYGAEGLVVAGLNRLLSLYNDTELLDGLNDKNFPGRGGYSSQKYNTNVNQPLYRFRDDYLAKSEKGKEYTKYYYELSKYGIKNNILYEYPNEHLELLLIGSAMTKDLQFGHFNNQILIGNDVAEKIKDMLNVYRNHKNHRDIDPVLDFLDLELKKYQNKPKSEISVDFN